jgi:hypothetical protein
MSIAHTTSITVVHVPTAYSPHHHNRYVRLATIETSISARTRLVAAASSSEKPKRMVEGG